MKGATLQYLVGALMGAFSLYQVYIKEYWEFALYACAGAAFLLVGLIKEERYIVDKKFSSILSWVLIFATAFIFFFLVRTDG
ncbi:MAG: hypothetical protein ABJH05_16735 [Fulvivirga sp.]